MRRVTKRLWAWAATAQRDGVTRKTLLRGGITREPMLRGGITCKSTKWTAARRAFATTTTSGGLEPMLFSSMPLVRHEPGTHGEATTLAAITDGTAQCLLTSCSNVLVDDQQRPLWLPKRRADEVIAAAGATAHQAVLGQETDEGAATVEEVEGARSGIVQEGGAVLVGMSVAADKVEAVAAAAGGSFVHLRALAMGGALTARHAAIVGRACSLLRWHTHAQFCGYCGGTTAASPTGHNRKCNDCGKTVFPRVDPIAIVAVQAESELGPHVLLGRQRHFPPGVYSCLAGFIEVAETIEEAVAREVLEEAGVALQPHNVTYRTSQPWPLPPSGAQLMIGCTAQAAPLPLRNDGTVDTAVDFDASELEHAAWFPASAVKRAIQAAAASVAPANDPAASARVTRSQLADWTVGTLLLVPPPLAVAHHLLRAAVE